MMLSYPEIYSGFIYLFNAVMCVFLSVLSRRSQQEGFKSAPKPYKAVGNNEKLLKNLFLEIMLRNKVKTHNLKCLF